MAGRHAGDIAPGAVESTVQPVRIEFGVGHIGAGHTEVVVVVVGGRMHHGSGRSDKVIRPVEGDIPDLAGCMEDSLLVPGRSIHLKT